MASKKFLGEGRRAETAGNLDGAIATYAEGLKKAPDDEELRSALESASKRRAKEHAEEARAHEAQGRHAEAVTSWRKAQKLDPKSRQLVLRGEAAEARNAHDPVRLAEALAEIERIAPKDKSAREELDKVRGQAVQRLLSTADLKEAAGNVEDAYQAYERARAIEPANPALQTARARAVKARRFEAIGDKKLKGGDGLGALEAYREASASAPLPGLTQKVDRAKRAAGSLLEQLEQARAHERLEEWEAAAELFTLLRDRPDAPPDVIPAAKAARERSAALRLSRANEHVRARDAEKARAALLLALEHTEGPTEEVDALTSAVSEIASARLVQAKAMLGRTYTLPAAETASHILTLSIEKGFEDAKARSTSDPAKAYLLVRDLRPFEKDLQGLRDLEKKLAPRAFLALLERAEPVAASGDTAEAAQMISAALAISRPPADLGELLATGSGALTRGEALNALDAFTEATSKDPKSKLAKAGERVARLMRLQELRTLVKESKNEPAKAAAAYRGILALDSLDMEARAGLERLGPDLIRRALSAAQAQQTAGHPATALVYVLRGLAIDPSHPELLARQKQLSEALPKPTPPSGFVAKINTPSDGCAGLASQLRPMLILYLAKSRGLEVPFLGTTEHAETKGPSPFQPLLTAKPTACRIDAQAGRAEADLELTLAGTVLWKEKVSASFDPSGLPKDEVAADPTSLDEGTARELALAAAKKLVEGTKGLGDWRSVWARAPMRADDAEATSYAYLALSAATKPAEKQTLSDLELYLAKRLP